MDVLPGTDHTRWEAKLALQFARDQRGCSVMSASHVGPLRVQKAFYPEGPASCHAIVLHPPGGIAGGDRLQVEVGVRQGAHALLTTPGATKWYRSEDALASQAICLTVDDDATLEWLPQEAIVFNGARMRSSLHIEQSATGRSIGWDVLCLGRHACGERFEDGALSIDTELRVDGRRVWHEPARYVGGDPLFDSPLGWGGRTVLGTLWAAGPGLSQEVIEHVQAVVPDCVLTQPEPSLLLARCLSKNSEEATQHVRAVWTALRVRWLQRSALVPRIWRT